MDLPPSTCTRKLCTKQFRIGTRDHTHSCCGHESHVFWGTLITHEREWFEEMRRCTIIRPITVKFFASFLWKNKWSRDMSLFFIYLITISKAGPCWGCIVCRITILCGNSSSQGGKCNKCQWAHFFFCRVKKKKKGFRNDFFIGCKVLHQINSLKLSLPSQRILKRNGLNHRGYHWRRTRNLHTLRKSDTISKMPWDKLYQILQFISVLL